MALHGVMEADSHVGGLVNPPEISIIVTTNDAV